MPLPSILEKIARATRARVERQRCAEKGHEGPGPVERLPLDFAAALRGLGPRVIAEVKLASPSEGTIGGDLDPVEVARQYVASGAAALSVLTEPDFFKGSVRFLEAIRPVAPVPILMKDFFLDPWQLDQAVAVGADCVLLIVALLEATLLGTLLAGARDRGLSALVEVHDEAELEAALGAGASLVGVNNRNLHTMEVSLDTARRLAPLAGGEGITLVCESGVESREEILELSEIGYDGFLVGTALIRGGRPGAALADLLGSEAA